MGDLARDFLVAVQRGIRPTLHLSTVPIVFERRTMGADRVEIHGTGVLVNVRGGRFLISAAHVFRPKVEYQAPICIPTGARTAEDIEGEITLPPMRPPKDAESEPTETLLDIGVLKLTDRRADALESLGMRFFPAEEILRVAPMSLRPGGYVLNGYPAADMHWQRTGELTPYYISCVRYQGDTSVLKENYDPSIHALLSLDSDNMIDHMTAKIGPLPVPTDGMSGSGVWLSYSPDDYKDGTWSPARLRLVGIYSSIYRKDKVAKFIPISHAIDFIDAKWPEARPPATPSHGPER